MEIHLSAKPLRQKTIVGKKHPQIPDFLIIGAGKSGTTSLDNYLKQHPEIFISRFKEPNFYGYELVKSQDLGGDPSELEHYNNSVTNLRDYLKLFDAARPGQLIGETSNTYMYHEVAAARIKYYNPNVKLIAVLRQPTERLYSRYLHLAREDKRPTENFADCLNPQTIWWRRNDLIKEGFYSRYLERFYKLFPSENIRVFLYEDFSKKPSVVLKEIFSFLGIDSAFEIDLSVKYNESGLIKNKFLDKIYGGKGIISKTVKAIFPETIVSFLRESTFVQKHLNKIRSKNLTKPKLDVNLYNKITEEVYREDIINLQELLGKDLSHWLKKKE